MRTLKPLLATASMLFAGASAAIQSYCPVVDRFCMSVGVPQSSAQSGSGNIYFQVQALAETYSWVAIGTGTSMTGSNMFIIYTDGAGNVTVSTRRGTGRTLPEPQTDTRIQLLAGSGVANGVMTANVACANCESWNGGTMDLDGSSTPWIAAWDEGSPLDTQSVDARIAKHQGRDGFSLDLTQALIAQDASPFATGGAAGAGNGAGNNGNTGGATNEGGANPVDLLVVHGVLMTLAFAFLYPLGAMLIPLARKWYYHAGCQVVGFLVMWIGFGTGYVTGRNVGTLFKDPHTIIGTIIVSAMVLQPILGLLHHRHYLKHQTRTVVSHVHIWHGRLLLVMGVVNGGIGLRAAGTPQTFTIVYSVAATAAGVAYIAAALVGRMPKAGMVERAKEVEYTPSSSAGGYGPGGGAGPQAGGIGAASSYGYQGGQGADKTRNQQYQFQAREGQQPQQQQQYGWSR